MLYVLLYFNKKWRKVMPLQWNPNKTLDSDARWSFPVGTHTVALREWCALIPPGGDKEIWHLGPSRPCPMSLFTGRFWFVSLTIKAYNPKYQAFLSFMSHPGESLNLRGWWEPPHLQPAGQKCRVTGDPHACGWALKGGWSCWGRVESARTPSTGARITFRVCSLFPPR